MSADEDGAGGLLAMKSLGATRSAFFVVLLIFVAAHSLLCSLVVPIGSGADENEHLDYALHLAAETRLPHPAYEPVGQIQHPPLPYLVYAGIYGITKSSFDDAASDDVKAGADILGRRTLLRPRAREADLSPAPAEDLDERARLRRETPFGVFHLMRLPSVFLGIATLICLLAAARRLLPQSPDLALLAVAAIGLTPHFAFHFSMVSNDPWLTFIAALAGWYALRQRARSTLLARRSLLTLSAMLGLAFFIKLHALGITVFCTLLVWNARDRKQAFGTRLLDLVWLASGPLVIAGWWHVRQVALQGGLLSLDHHADYKPFLFRLGDLNPVIALDVLASTTRSFFAVMGQDSIETHALYYIPICGLAWLVLFATVFIRPQSSDAGGKPEDASAAARPPLWAALIAVAVLLIAILSNNRHYIHIHGRYFFAALVPLLVLFLGGTERLFGRHRRSLILGATVWGAVFLPLTLWFIIFPRYSVSASKFVRGEVVAYWDCGHPRIEFDRAVAGQPLPRHFPRLALPEQTMRAAPLVPGGIARLVYATELPDSKSSYQVRVRYPFPHSLLGGDVPAPTAVVLFADNVPVHGQRSMWSAHGEFHYVLPRRITRDGRVRLHWSNPAPGALGVACAELWIEKAWLRLEGPVRLVVGDGGGAPSVGVTVVNGDELNERGATLMIMQGPKELSRSRVRVSPGSHRAVTVSLQGQGNPKAEELEVRVFDESQSPWVDVKLAYWARPEALKRGLHRVPDIETLRHVVDGGARGVLSEWRGDALPLGRYRIGISHPDDQSPFSEGVLGLEVDGAGLEASDWQVEAAAYGEGLRVSFGTLSRESMDGGVAIRLIARDGGKHAAYDVDRLILTRLPSPSAPVLRYGVTVD